MPLDGEALRAAARLVEAEIAKLDVSEAVCPCCGINRWSNRWER